MPTPGATIRMWAAGDQPTKAGKPPKAPKPPKSKSTGPNKKLPKEVRRAPTWLRIIKWTAIAGLSLMALAIATVALVFYIYGRDPALNKLDFTRLSDYHPKQLIEVLDANDQRIGELVFTDHTERRTMVSFEQTPTILVDSFVAAEDNSFWEHGGVDYWGMFRAAVTNLRSGKKQGASTITQQVVKTFLLTPEQTYKRKIQEVILARRLEHALTKEEIITLYMNQIYFGHGRYGVQEASRFYFGHPVSRWDAKDKKWISLMNPGEAAMLAGIVQAPEKISPRKPANQPRAKERQTYVLNQLVKMGKIQQDEAQKYINAPIQIVRDPFPELDTAPEWVALVKKQLLAEWKDKGGEDELAKLGGTVRTTLDPSIQNIAQKALQSALRAVDKRHDVGRPVRTVKPDKLDAEVAKLTKKLPRSGPAPKEMYDALVTKVHDDDKELEVDLGGWQAALVLGGEDDARFNPDDKKPSERFKSGDVVEVSLPPAVRRRSEDEEEAAGEKTKQHEIVAKHAKNRVVFAPGPEGAVVVLDVHTRKVKALVGGYSPHSQFNRAIQAQRQAGSSFKPYVYTTAFEWTADHPTDEPKHTPARIVNDAQEAIGTWTAKNYETGKFEGPVRLRKALALSINTVAIIVGEQIGPDRAASASKIAAMARAMGIVNTKLPETWSLSIGAGEVTPLDNTNGMATLAAGGIAAPPVFIEAIDGKPAPIVKGEQVIRPEVAYVMTNMMQSVVTEGTGIKVSALKIPVAGKTGTSNDEKDTWFVGLTPDLAIGTWIGYDEPRHMPHEQGGVTAAPVYVDIMKQLNPPAKQFVRPAHVVERTIDKESGLLAPEGAPKGSTMTEVFVEGTAPTETAAKPGDVTPDNAVSCEYDRCD